MLNSLKRELKKPNGADPKGRPTLTTLGTDDNLIDALFGMKMEQEFKCVESDEEPVTKKGPNFENFPRLRNWALSRPNR